MPPLIHRLRLRYLLLVWSALSLVRAFSADVPQVFLRRPALKTKNYNFELNLYKDEKLQQEEEQNGIEFQLSQTIADETGIDVTVRSSKKVVTATFLSGLTAMVFAAKTGILHGAFDKSIGEFGLYTNAMISQDIGMTVLCVLLGYALVQIIGLGYEKDFYGPKVSRKLSHTLSAPLLMALFPFFSAADGSRFFAGLVIFTNVIRLYLAGNGYDTKLANAVSRSGDKSEALGGPFIYVCLFQLSTLLFWRTNMIGVIAMSTMAAGDGMADLLGRKFGRTNKWWFSEDKSIAGSVAFAISSALTSLGLVQLFMATGFYQSILNPVDMLLRIIGISVACAIIELIPVGDDNYTVPISAGVLAAVFLQ